MAHSVFTGRVVDPGEPAFLPEDTDAAIALEEEERDTCPSCGMPKAWCRDAASQFNTFEVREEQCHATYVLAAHQNKLNEKRDPATRASMQSWARFTDGKQPDYMAGLDLAEYTPEQDDNGDQK